MNKITIALAGNANVGKSVIFNYLTGLHQHIGNWPGKTVEKAEGTLFHGNFTIDIVDLPGIYSLSTFSMEELISREYIAKEKPDVVINVVDATNLERNLYFTLQLLELGRPMIIALNQMDLLKKKGMFINIKKLEKILGIKVIPVVATQGKGIHELVDNAIDIFREDGKKSEKIKYGKEVEKEIQKLTKLLSKIELDYPKRFLAIKLLEGDEEIKKMIQKIDSNIIKIAEKHAKKLERVHGHDRSTVIASERYKISNEIVKDCVSLGSTRVKFSDKLHEITTHGIFGYLIMILSVLSLFCIIFTFGNFFSSILVESLESLNLIFSQYFGTGIASNLAWGIIEGLIAGITVVLPFILPFYIILGLLEDSGYLSRIAFLMDKFMHNIGLHGKAFIPLMLGYGCDVPACLGCRIMETKRERLIAIFVVTLIPCAAVTTVILGLVGKYVGLGWAFLLYIVDFMIVFVLGRIAFKILPGEPTELIMEMNPYRMPHLETVAKQAWFRIKDFIYIAFPLIIACSFIIKVLDVTNLSASIDNLIKPITVDWLGLPVFSGITLIFGIVRKELTLVMLATLGGTTNFAAILNPIQMIVFSFVIMLYIPCIATIAALVKEIGWKKAVFITVFRIVFAIFVGGIVFRLLTL